MGLLERIQADRRVESRVIGGAPWRPWDSPYWKFSQGGPVHPTRAFYGVDKALGLPALYSCTRLLAESLASLPVKIYTRAGSQGSAVRYTGPSIFDQPSATANLYDWLYQCMVALVLHGNAWGLISGRDGFGYPTGIEWVPPDMVTVEDDSQQPWNPLRTRVYVYGRQVSNWRDELFHVRAYTVPGRTEGISPLRAFAQTVMAGLEAQQYGTDWFEAGGFPPGTFQNCVDTETEILSRDGWLRYDQVKPGDEVLTLDTETGLAEWQPVKRVYVNDGPNEVVAMRNLSHSSVSTLNHRWPVMVSGRYKVRKDGSTWEDPARWRWYHTDSLPRDARICAAAPVVSREAKWSDAMAELTAWFFTEGTVGGTGHVVISQSSTTNPEKVACIRAALTEVFGTPSPQDMQFDRARPQWQERVYPHPDYQGKPYAMTTFHLNTAAGRVLTAVAPGKVVTTRFLSELTRAQLELFIRTAIDGDGSLAGRGTVPSLAQTDVRRLEAFQVACALAGRSGVIRETGNGQYSMGVQKTVWRKPNGRPEYVTRKTIDGPVWCPSTENKTWFARRDGTCYFTGNTEIEIDTTAAAEIRESLTSSIRHKQPLVYGRDWDYKPVVVPPSEAQFIEAMQMNATQLAAVYGLPPDRVGGARGDSLTYNTVEQSTLQVIEALRPWMVRLETAFFSLLPSNRYVRFNADALLKTDLKTRTEIYTAQRNMGLRNIDELRDLEDLPPLAGAAGGENIPLEVMIAMARSIRGIPNSMLKSLTLEMDLAADKLEELQAQNPPLAQPDTEPAAPSATSMLGSILGSIRGLENADSDDVIAVLRELAMERKRRRDTAEGKPEFVGPWIPSESDLARLTGVNGNGNGRHY